jgi:hypothetical protein
LIAAGNAAPRLFIAAAVDFQAVLPKKHAWNLG